MGTIRGIVAAWGQEVKQDFGSRALVARQKERVFRELGIGLDGSLRKVGALRYKRVKRVSGQGIWVSNMSVCGGKVRQEMSDYDVKDSLKREFRGERSVNGNKKPKRRVS